MVGANLVAESARPAVGHHAHLIRVKAHGCSGRLVVYLIDRLHFEKVIAGPEAADLQQAALDSARTHLRGISPRNHAVVLAAIEVALRTVAALDRVTRSAQQDFSELVLVAQSPDSAPAHPPRDRAVQAVHQLT